jgi:hypothetical protein
MAQKYWGVHHQGRWAPENWGLLIVRPKNDEQCRITQKTLRKKAAIYNLPSKVNSGTWEPMGVPASTLILWHKNFGGAMVSRTWARPV